MTSSTPAGFVDARRDAGARRQGTDSGRQGIPSRRPRAQSDGMLPEQVAPKLAELGPDGVLADLGPNLQAQAGAVATTPARDRRQSLTP